jgi:hypothetical protein
MCHESPLHKKDSLMDDMSKQIEQALSDPDIPKLYGNSFTLALGLGDVTILMLNGPKPVALFNLSFSMAKTLSLKLQDLIGLLESKSGQFIMTSDDVTKFLKKKEESNDSAQ